jgi:hypothetical protein
VGVKTYSAFTYGHTITDSNKYIDFDEGAGELTATIVIGSYSLEEFKDAVAVALNAAGGQEYTVTINRTTRRLTISASSTFNLLAATGTNDTQSAYDLMGFVADTGSATSHEGENASGSFFEPQNILQKFVDFQDNIKTTNSTKRQTATGRVEVVSYGNVSFMECNIVPITDISPQLSIKNNVNAVSDFRAFMNYCITKAPIEFIQDIDTPSTFTKCLLESTRESKDGVDFKIKELFSRKLFGYYESGTLTFRGL